MFHFRSKEVLHICDFLLYPEEHDVYYPVIQRHDQTLSALNSHLNLIEERYELYENQLEEYRESFTVPPLMCEFHRIFLEDKAKFSHLQKIVLEYLGLPHAYDFVPDVDGLFSELLQSLKLNHFEDEIQLSIVKFDFAKEQLQKLKAEVAQLEASAKVKDPKIVLRQKIRKRKEQLIILNEERRVLDISVQNVQNHIDELNRAQLERELRQQKKQQFKDCRRKMRKMDKLYCFTISANSIETQFNFFQCFRIRVQFDDDAIIQSSASLLENARVDDWTFWKAKLASERTQYFDLLSKLQTRSDLTAILQHLSTFAHRVNSTVSFLEDNMDIAGCAPCENNVLALYTEGANQKAIQHFVKFPVDYPSSPLLLQDVKDSSLRRFTMIDEVINHII